MREIPTYRYFFITIVLFLVLIYVGLNLKDFLIEKFPSKDLEETKKSIKEEPEREDPEPVYQARAIWGVGVIIAIILLIIYLAFKLVIIKSSRN